MVFALHFLAAAGFTLFLYFGATYSSLKTQMNDLISLDDEIQALIIKMADITSSDPRHALYQNELCYDQKIYHEKLQEFEYRRHSWYSKVLLRFCKSLRQDFTKGADST